LDSHVDIQSQASAAPQLDVGTSHRWRGGSFSHNRILYYAVIIATLFSLVTVAFFLHWGVHGLYTDDYGKKAWAFDFTTSKWRLNLHPMYSAVRPLAYILITNAANAIPEHEFPLRAGIVAVHLLNVMLLAMFAYRLSQSLFVSVLAGALFLFPFIAYDALLWFTASVHNIFGLLFLLLGFHLILSCRNIRRDVGLLVCGVLCWQLMLLFFEVGLLIQALLPVFFWMIYRENRKLNRIVCISALAGSFIPQALYCFIWERTAPMVAVRGRVTLDPGFLLFHRIPDVFRRTLWLITGGGIHVSIFGEALRLGFHEWLSSGTGDVLLVVAILGVAALVLVYPADHERILEWHKGFTLFSTGVAWAVLGLAIILIFSGQNAESRMFYIPYAGISLGVAGLMGSTAALFGRWQQVAIRGLLLGMGAILLVNSLTMAGLVRAFQLRWSLDRKQLVAFRSAVPVVPDSSPLWVLPVTLDERAISVEAGKDSFMDRWFPGVFEQSFSACDALRLMYGDRNMRCAASTRWGKLHVTGVQYSVDGRVSTLFIQGNAVPVDDLLAFTYRNGRVTILNPLELTSGVAATEVVNLPLATSVAQERHAETEPIRFDVELNN